jgi:hypothetical protein
MAAPGQGTRRMSSLNLALMLAAASIFVAACAGAKLYVQPPK